MGTLFNQPKRSYDTISDEYIVMCIREIKKISQQIGISIDQTIRILELLEKEKTNNISVQNGDIHDEQMKGF